VSDESRRRLHVTLAAAPEAVRRPAHRLLAAAAAEQVSPHLLGLLEQTLGELADHALRQREQIAAVRVDADRQVREAARRALDCADHGRVIAELEQQVDHYSATEQRAERGRLALLGGLRTLGEMLRRAPTPTRAEITELYERTSSAHKRAWR